VALDSSSNVPVSASITQGSAVSQPEQRGVPRGIGPTRLRAPQEGHAMIDMSASLF
jgi:hypothetical protein